jgi:hypothetical protein
MYKPSTFVLVTYFPTYIWDLLPTELVTNVKPNVNSVEVHLQLSTYGHPVDGALVGAYSLQLTWFISIVQLGFNCRQCHHDGKMHVPSIKCVISPGWWTNQSGVNKMQWPDFHIMAHASTFAYVCKCVFSKTYSVGCVIGPSVTMSSTDFSFQNLVFWNLFEFLVAEIT